MVDGVTVGVFGTNPKAKEELEASVAKKSETDGIVVYHRKEGERRISFLDDAGFPERIQGYARVASLSDFAIYIPPAEGKLTPPDGELAVLLECFKLPGSVATGPSSDESEWHSAMFKGTVVGTYAPETRAAGSPLVDLSRAAPRPDLCGPGALVYVDRAFNVNGLGTVALGFVLSGTVSLHDELRPTPLPRDTTVEVKGIQVNDVDFEKVGRGVRVGLALRGVDAKSLQKTHWLDDGSYQTSDRLKLSFAPSPFYRQPVENRDLHLQLPGEMVTASFSKGQDSELKAQLPFHVPAWQGMRASVVDLNGKGLRVAGGCMCNA